MARDPLVSRRLGETGLPVTRIGLGLAALGRPGYLNLGHDRDLGDDRRVEVLERNTHSVLDAAWDEGIRYFDAARSYGRGESFLGSWLEARALSPEAVTVGSKWGYTYTAGWRVDAEVHEVKDHSLDALRRGFAASKEALGEHLDLYQIHSATLETGVLENEEVLAELIGMRDRGLAIGLTTSGPRGAEVVGAALETEVDGVNPFSVVQSTWNLLEPSAGPALAEAHDAGWGVIVKEALANGRLTARNDDPAFKPARAVLSAAAARHDATLDAYAVAAVLAQPWADVVLSGASTTGQLRSNLAAIGVAPAPAELRELASLAEPPDAYWATRAALPWT
jgi:aryl-alcohol dehydrogenase-like predicted oxidoreductase